MVGVAPGEEDGMEAVQVFDPCVQERVEAGQVVVPQP